ncbi:hypothetical protein GQ42DRAFT_164061 [Ramicandelaber brevisporus]|nr:hypothetical protein GQ42DRAFT_164061 [Ramicandelaber brevisporus]
MSWIAGAESRGQEVNVDWHLVAFSRDNSEWIDDFLSSIDKPEQHSISLDQSISTFSIKQVSKLASMLVAASFPTPMSEPVTDAFNSLFAIGQDDIVFQRVRQLNLELPLSSDGAEDSIVPDLSVAHFPALESLNLGFTAIRNRQFGINVVPGIWASITTLRLECCYDAYWNIIAKCVPNLRILRFNFTHLTLDLALMAKYMPQLENLEVGEGCDVDFLHNEDSKSAQLLNLYSFEVDKSESVNSYLSLDEFEFIVHNAPNLQSVKFAHGWFEGSTLDELNGAVNASVRNLFVSFYGALIENDDFDAMISVFPNLAKLELDQDPLSEELFSSLRERYPSINIRHVTL